MAASGRFLPRTSVEGTTALGATSPLTRAR